MYAASLVFLAAAIGSLLLSTRSGGLTLVFVSIGCSVMSALFLAVSVLRRATDEPAPGTAPSDWSGPAHAAGAVAVQAPGETRVALRPLTVLAIPKRAHYHRESCRFVQGRDDASEMTVEVARRAGYTPCGTCKPD